MTFPYHHGSANYGQRPSESEHLVRDVYLGNIICSCSHVAQVSNMPICTDGGKKKKKQHTFTCIEIIFKNRQLATNV